MIDKGTKVSVFVSPPEARDALIQALEDAAWHCIGAGYGVEVFNKATGDADFYPPENWRDRQAKPIEVDLPFQDE